MNNMHNDDLMQLGDNEEGHNDEHIKSDDNDDEKDWFEYKNLHDSMD